MNSPSSWGSLRPPPARVALLCFSLFPSVCHLIWVLGWLPVLSWDLLGRGRGPHPGRRARLCLLHATSPVIRVQIPAAFGTVVLREASRRTEGLWCGCGSGGGCGEGRRGRWVSLPLEGPTQKGTDRGTALRPTGWYSKTVRLAFGRWTGWDRSIGHSANRTCPDLPVFPTRSPAAL